MMEFLPHTKNKNYIGNVKNGRFISAVLAFKGRKSFDSGQTIRVMAYGKGNIFGEEDALKEIPFTKQKFEPIYTTTVTCLSQRGELYAIHIKEFKKLIKEDQAYLTLQKNGLMKEMNILKILEGQLKLEDQNRSLQKEDFPNKYLDDEIKFMKQIREAYFEPKEEELFLLEKYYLEKEDQRKRVNKKPNEITEATFYDEYGTKKEKIKGTPVYDSKFKQLQEEIIDNREHMLNKKTVEVNFKGVLR